MTIKALLSCCTKDKIKIYIELPRWHHDCNFVRNSHCDLNLMTLQFIRCHSSALSSSLANIKFLRLIYVIFSAGYAGSFVKSLRKEKVDRITGLGM
jgi:hypothetical protein